MLTFESVWNSTPGPWSMPFAEHLSTGDGCLAGFSQVLWSDSLTPDLTTSKAFSINRMERFHDPWSLEISNDAAKDTQRQILLFIIDCGSERLQYMLTLSSYLIRWLFSSLEWNCPGLGLCYFWIWLAFLLQSNLVWLEYSLTYIWCKPTTNDRSQVLTELEELRYGGGSECKSSWN